MRVSRARYNGRYCVEVDLGEGALTAQQRPPLCRTSPGPVGEAQHSLHIGKQEGLSQSHQGWDSNLPPSQYARHGIPALLPPTPATPSWGRSPWVSLWPFHPLTLQGTLTAHSSHRHLDLTFPSPPPPFFLLPRRAALTTAFPALRGHQRLAASNTVIVSSHLRTTVMFQTSTATQPSRLAHSAPAPST